MEPAAMDAVLIPTFLCLGLGAALYARVIPQGGRSWWAWAAAMVALVLASRLAGHAWPALVLADLAELAAVGLVASAATPDATAAARKYLLAVVLAVLLGGFARIMIGLGPDSSTARVAVAALVVAFALRVGLVPVYFWLPAVARATSAMTTALIIGVVDVGAFCELLALRQNAPWVFEHFPAVWIALAVASMLGGALLALAQSELKPMLAFSSIADLGALLLGLLLGGRDGSAAAWFGILSHGCAKLVLFGAVGAAEFSLGRPVTLTTRGLAARLPLASAAFMLAAAAVVGIPPTLGFVGHWRLILAGAELGGAALVAVELAATALALLVYVRAIHRTWLGPGTIAETGRPMPATAGAVLLVFALAPVLFGFMPDRLAPAAPPPALAALEGASR
jgi:NADH:ubiquinone oxidoreductase subunit 2 (subunit N)